MLYCNNNHNDSLLRPVGVRGRFGGARGRGGGGRRRGGVRDGRSGGHVLPLFLVTYSSLTDLLTLLLRMRFAAR
jgi:hypothetical protein